MFTRACLAFTALAFLVATSMTHASGIGPGPYSPITYDFSGVLNQPIGGSKAFSGSVSFDNGVLPGIGTDEIGAGTPPVGTAPATLRVAGLTFAFTNPTTPNPGPDPGTWTPPLANPQILFTFNATGASNPGYGYLYNEYTRAGLPIPGGGAQGFLLTTNQAGTSASGQSASMTINLLNTAGNIWALSPNATTYPGLSLPDFNVNQFNLQISQPNGSQVSATGHLTNLEPEVATPEPSTIAIFSLLAACSLIYRHVRRPSGSRACENDRCGLGVVGSSKVGHAHG